MSAYTDRVDAVRNKSGNLFRQVIFATWQSAKDILLEPVGVNLHAARLIWANKIRFGGVAAAEAFAERAMPQVILDAGISANPETATDAAVQAVVTGAINSLIDKG